jgi:hypothetical protein
MPSAQIQTAQNISVGIFLGGNSQGSGLTPGAPSSAVGTVVERRCLARSYSRSLEIGTVEAGAFCDVETKVSPTRKSGTIEMELLLPTGTAALFLDKEGFYIKVTAAIGPTTYTDFGLITSTGISAEVDGYISETLTIVLGVNGITSFGGV